MIDRPSGLGAQPNPEFEEEKRTWEAASAKGKPRTGPGSGAVDRTISDVPLKTVYGPEDVAHLDLARDLSWPGSYPYTRGIHPNGYRDRLWTMRQFAGFGNAKQTNERYHFLLSQGQHGLSVAFDMPTLMGYDSDAPQARGEVGKCGVAIDSLRDMEVLFDGIDMGDITTSMTINGPAAIAVAQYIAAAEKKGIPRAKLGGTIQADILKEYIAQKEWIFPPRPHMRVIVDMIEFCTRRDAEVEHDLDFRLSHSRSGFDRRAGVGVHAGRRVRVRRSGYGARTRRRFVCAASLVLLQFAHRLLRRDREVPRCAPHLRASHAREIRREESEVVAAALPHADRRLQRDRAAAREQHRSRRVRSDGRGARRHAVAAYQLDGRSARAARPKNRSRSRCARSKCSRTRPTSRTSSIRSAVRTSSKRSPTRWSARPKRTSRRSKSTAA